MSRRRAVALVSALLPAVALGALSPGSGQFTGVAGQGLPAAITVDGELLAPSPDGQWLAGIDADETSLCAWRVEDPATPAACADLAAAGVDSPARAGAVWSPDSTRIAIDDGSGINLLDTDLLVMDVATGSLTNLTDDGVAGRSPRGDQPGAGTTPMDSSPAWTPDGESIVFARSLVSIGDDPQSTAIARVPAAGGEVEEIATVSDESGLVIGGGMWVTAGGETVVFARYGVDVDERVGVWTVPVAGGEPEQLLQVAGVTIVALSPDGTQAILSGSGDILTGSVIALLDLATGDVTPIAVDTGSEGDSAGSVAFSPDGERLAVWTRLAGQVSVRDLADAGDAAAGEVLAEELDGAGAPGQEPLFAWASDGTLFIPVYGEDGSTIPLQVPD